MSQNSKQPTKTKPSRLEIKENIVNAAIMEFSQHSFLGASTQAIAERAGLKKSQLHYYIEDKESLYADVLTRLFSAWKQFSSFDQLAESDPINTLKNYIEVKLRFAFEQPELSRIFTSELLSGGQRLDAFWPDAMGSAKVNIQTIHAWVAAKKIRPLDGRLLLMNIWALTQYYADYAIQAEQLLESPLQDSSQQQAIIDEVTKFVLLGCDLSTD